MSKKKYNPSFKFHVVLEVLKGSTQIQTARKYGISHKLISKWLAHFKQHGHTTFDDSNCSKMLAKLQKKIKDLELIIGKKEVEILFLKNFLDTNTNPGS